MIQVGILNRGKALLPERLAYARYFASHSNIAVSEISSVDACQEHALDILLVFLGWEPQWRFSGGRHGPAIVGDLCLSTGIAPRAKDALKRAVNVRPDFRVTQTASMARVAGWSIEQTILRSQGFHPHLVRPRAEVPDFDLVYAGTIRRRGVIRKIEALAGRGFRIAVAAPEGHAFVSPNVSHLGSLAIEDVYDVYSRSRAGLNFVPDRRPFNTQMSSKVVEYLGSGLPVVSNTYMWMKDFSRARGVSYLDVDSLKTPDQLNEIAVPAAYLGDLEWPNIMASTRLVERYLEFSSRGS